ncbi:MAG: hypothetical protein IKD12_07640 [Paludibacteraceae bacterium]|nr:hypothetical protein [Paludibacteraceae bacterium]
MLVVGCDSSNTNTTQTSSIAKLTAFSFVANDSMPGLGKAVFTIEERIDTGLVYNKDSMLYGTSLERVVPRFVFQVAVGTATLKMPDTTLTLTGYDTLNFSKQPIYLTLTSTDRTTTKVYEIRPTVHQADPDLFVWEQLTDVIYPADESEQRVVELAGDFVMIANNGFSNTAFASADGASWYELGTPSGLPASARVRQIISDGLTLYYADGTTLYTSDDALTWTPQTMSYEMKTMLMNWNGRVWVLVDNNGLELAYLGGTDISLTGLRPDDEFPISDFATVQFESASQRARAMIIGGYAETGKSLNTRWNFEYSPQIKENDGYRINEFSIDRPTFTSLTGISVIWYDDKLMLFGGVDANMTYLGRDILISDDEGLNWTKADTAKNQLPEVYQARQKQTAIVRDNNIYLFGGKDKTTTYSDVYKGRLNSIDW